MVRWLFIVGGIFIAAGLAVWAAQKLGLGRLPGDIVIERENLRLYIPLGTSILISVVLSLLLWLFHK